MDTTKPLLSGLAATIVGTIGTLLAAASPVLPAPWATVAGIVGFLMAALAGLSVAAPKVTEGKPVLQGVALTIATGALSMLVQFYAAIPVGWPQSIALGLAALLAWLTGAALPALGTPATPAIPSRPVTNLDDAAKLLGGK